MVFTPAPGKVKGRKSTFHNHFWNPIMFAWAPMTIGCLIHADEPVFADFPTSYHTDWQWWDILENAKVIEMQQTPTSVPRRASCSKASTNTSGAIVSILRSSWTNRSSVPSSDKP